MSSSSFENHNRPLANTPFITHTRGVRIAVKPEYDADRSSLAAGRFFYAYTISITNESSETVQLVSRHWIIKDGFENTEHVAGEGVVGQQPTLKPGETFTYTSYCPLTTPTGSMQGTFQMKTARNENFDAEIGEFLLRNSLLVN